MRVGENHGNDIQTPQRGAERARIAEALAYRTPKKPESKNYHFGGMFLPACPTCGEFLTDEDYCPKCGQAIEWGEYDEES